MSDYKEFEYKMKKTCESLTTLLATIRAGRANAAVLDQIQVDYYGVPTPIQQVASIATPDPRSLTIQPWDGSTMKLIEKAIQQIETIRDRLIPAAERLVRELTEKGVEIVSAGNGKLAQAGGENGFVIKFVNDQKVSKPADVIEIAKKASRTIVIEGVTATGRQGYFAFGKDE